MVDRRGQTFEHLGLHVLVPGDLGHLPPPPGRDSYLDGT
jgi:hypothetical protein